MMIYSCFGSLNVSIKYSFVDGYLQKRKTCFSQGIEHSSNKGFPVTVYATSLETPVVINRLGEENVHSIGSFFNEINEKFGSDILWSEERLLTLIGRIALAISRNYPNYVVKMTAFEEIVGHCMSSDHSSLVRKTTRYSSVRIRLKHRNKDCNEEVHYFTGESNNVWFWKNLDVGEILKSLEEKLRCSRSQIVSFGLKEKVLLGAGSGGILFHEACGHMLESDKILNGLSVFRKMMKEQIAPSFFNLIDDPLIENSFGYSEFDDEGIKCSSKQIITNGFISEFFCINEDLKYCTDFKSPGNSRRENYRSVNSARMSNTFVLPTDNSFEQLVDNVESGVYCKELQSGIVSPYGDYSFYCPVLYEIKNGIIGAPLRPSFVRGNIVSSLKNIIMIGKELCFASGFCSGRSGKIPVSVGQPAVLIGNLEII